MSRLPLFVWRETSSEQSKPLSVSFSPFLALHTYYHYYYILLHAYARPQPKPKYLTHDSAPPYWNQHKQTPTAEPRGKERKNCCQQRCKAPIRKQLVATKTTLLCSVWFVPFPSFLLLLLREAPVQRGTSTERCVERSVHSDIFFCTGSSLPPFLFVPNFYLQCYCWHAVSKPG